MDAVQALFEMRPGTWQLKFSEENGPGASFWKRIAEKYHGTFTALEAPETAVTIHYETGERIC